MAKREGHATVSVYMLCREAHRIVDFLRDIFGGDIILRYDGAEGALMHASVRVGDSTITIADGMAEFSPFPVWMHVYVADVDETYRRALEYRAVSVEEPKDQPDGDRRGGVKDSAENIWWIASAKT